MDIWKFYDITHREHRLCNPTSEEKLERLIGLLRLDRGQRVVDIACGKGQFLIRLAQVYGVKGLGIDISPYFVAEAERMRADRVPASSITFSQMDGATFKPEKAHGFRMASCLGASWIFSGHTGTLNALVGMVEPGGWIIVGEPYWLQEPSPDFLKAFGCRKDTFGTHTANAEAGEKIGLRLVHTLVSTKDDFDRYEGLQWFAADAYARVRHDDPDVPELVARVAKSKESYLREGRDTLGWAIYAFRRPDEAA
jgi:SAM-dependent methyltransferase